MKFALITCLCVLILRPYHDSEGFQFDPEGEGRAAGQINLQGGLHEQEEVPLPGAVTAAATSSARPEAGMMQGGMPESTDEEHDIANDPAATGSAQTEGSPIIPAEGHAAASDPVRSTTRP